MSDDAMDQGVILERAAEDAMWLSNGSDRIEWEVWVCPHHGVISEDELLEGHDGTMFGPHPGSDGYTGEFFCARDHDGPNPSVEQHDIRSSAWASKRRSEKGE